MAIPERTSELNFERFFKIIFKEKKEETCEKVASVLCGLI